MDFGGVLLGSNTWAGYYNGLRIWVISDLLLLLNWVKLQQIQKHVSGRMSFPAVPLVSMMFAELFWNPIDHNPKLQPPPLLWTLGNFYSLSCFLLSMQ